jgi:hypothetical protein
MLHDESFIAGQLCLRESITDEDRKKPCSGSGGDDACNLVSGWVSDYVGKWVGEWVKE